MCHAQYLCKHACVTMQMNAVCVCVSRIIITVTSREQMAANLKENRFRYHVTLHRKVRDFAQTDYVIKDRLVYL